MGGREGGGGEERGTAFQAKINNSGKSTYPSLIRSLIFHLLDAWPSCTPTVVNKKVKWSRMVIMRRVLVDFCSRRLGFRRGSGSKGTVAKRMVIAQLCDIEPSFLSTFPEQAVNRVYHPARVTPYL